MNFQNNIYLLEKVYISYAFLYKLSKEGREKKMVCSQNIIVKAKDKNKKVKGGLTLANSCCRGRV